MLYWLLGFLSSVLPKFTLDLPQVKIGVIVGLSHIHRIARGNGVLFRERNDDFMLKFESASEREAS